MVEEGVRFVPIEVEGPLLAEHQAGRSKVVLLNQEEEEQIDDMIVAVDYLEKMAKDLPVQLICPEEHVAEVDFLRDRGEQVGVLGADELDGAHFPELYGLQQESELVSRCCEVVDAHVPVQSRLEQVLDWRGLEVRDFEFPVRELEPPEGERLEGAEQPPERLREQGEVILREIEAFERQKCDVVAEINEEVCCYVEGLEIAKTLKVLGQFD